MFIEKLDLNNENVKNYFVNLFKENLQLDNETEHLVDNIKIEKHNNLICLSVNGFIGKYGTYYKSLKVNITDFSVEASSNEIGFNVEGFKKGYFKFMAENFKNNNEKEDYFSNFLKMLKTTVEACFDKKVKLEVVNNKEKIKNKLEEFEK